MSTKSTSSRRNPKTLNILISSKLLFKKTAWRFVRTGSGNQLGVSPKTWQLATETASLGVFVLVDKFFQKFLLKYTPRILWLSHGLMPTKEVPSCCTKYSWLASIWLWWKCFPTKRQKTSKITILWQTAFRHNGVVIVMNKSNRKIKNTNNHYSKGFDKKSTFTTTLPLIRTNSKINSRISKNQIVINQNNIKLVGIDNNNPTHLL